MTLDLKRLVSEAQQQRLESLGATITNGVITATEEQLWTARILGEQRQLLEERSQLTIGGGGNILQLNGQDLQLNGQDLTLG